MVGLHCSPGFSLAAASQGYSAVACRLLIAVASLVEDGLQGIQASVAAVSWLWSAIVAMPRLGCSMECGIFLI